MFKWYTRLGLLAGREPLWRDAIDRVKDVQTEFIYPTTELDNFLFFPSLFLLYSFFHGVCLFLNLHACRLFFKFHQMD